MAFARPTAQITYEGVTYVVDPGQRIEDFGATRGGVAVTDPSVLAALYAGAKGLNYLERFLRYGDDDKLISAIYREQLVNILMRFKAAIIATPAAWLFAQNVKLICSGGCTQIGGFVQMLASLIHELDLPVKLSEILVCCPDQFRMTRGGMIQMELDCLSDRALISA